MYGYFIKRPVRTKVKSVKIYALDNAIQPQALQITISINDFLRFKHYSITVLLFLKSKNIAWILLLSLQDVVGDVHYVRRAVPWAMETIGLSARLCLFCYFQPTTACLVTNAPNGATSS